MANNTFHRAYRISAFVVLGLLIACAAWAQPTWDKVFSPDTIGPGSVSTLTFSITNGDPAPVTDLAFSDTLPGGVTIATPASASTDCFEAVLSALDGGSTVSLTDGRVGAGETCTVLVNVTSSTVGTHTNTTGDLTSSAGNSGTSSDALTVTADRPGFSKSFSPSTVALGGRSTLTFTIDNSANASVVASLDFNDNLPVGMVVALPANAATDCTSTTFPATLTATPGSSVVALFAVGVGADRRHLALVGDAVEVAVRLALVGNAVGVAVVAT